MSFKLKHFVITLTMLTLYVASLVKTTQTWHSSYHILSRLQSTVVESVTSISTSNYSVHFMHLALRHAQVSLNTKILITVVTCE